MTRVTKKGFSFIEFIVVIAVISLTLPVLLNIIFVLFQQQLKLMSMTEIKRQGDYTLLVISNIIRNEATGIYSDLTMTTPWCEDTGSSLLGNSVYLSNKNNQFIHFFADGDTIASESSIISKISLTNNKVKITNFNVQCYKSATYSSPFIAVYFDIEYKTNNIRDEEKASMRYQTGIKLNTAE